MFRDIWNLQHFKSLKSRIGLNWINWISGIADIKPKPCLIIPHSHFTMFVLHQLYSKRICQFSTFVKVLTRNVIYGIDFLYLVGGLEMFSFAARLLAKKYVFHTINEAKIEQRTAHMCYRLSHANYIMRNMIAKFLRMTEISFKFKAICSRFWCSH